MVMKANKLTIEEQFLTLDQAKELQELGIDFSCAIYCFGKRIKDGRGNKMLRQKSFLCPSGNHGVRYVLLEQYEFIPTLSVAEMFEMLPNEIACMEDGYLTSYSLMYDGYSLGYVEWCGGEKAHHKINISEGEDFTDGYEICLRKWNLRDALFEMIKLLKQNKFI